ncbi:MAG: hypothetical protein ABH950_06705 [Candidatus Altiarchaeota archaeon]
MNMANALKEEMKEEADEKQNADKRPDFNVKAGGNFVGSAWLNQGTFGPYISVVLKDTAKNAERLYVYPRKGKEGMLAEAKEN